jgi:hypothetical protein
MTKLERAERLTGESGSRPASNRTIKRIPPRDVELIGAGAGSSVFNAIHIETTASSSSDVATLQMN